MLLKESRSWFEAWAIGLSMLLLGLMASGCSSSATTPPGGQGFNANGNGGGAGTAGAQNMVTGTGGSQSSGSGARPGAGAGPGQGNGGTTGTGGYNPLGGGRSGGGLPGAGGALPQGMGGMLPAGMGGMLPAGMGGMAPMGMGGQGGGAGAPPMGTGGVMTNKDPTIPPVNGMCPNFTNSTIDFMGISGLQIVAGTKPAAPTAPMVLYWHGTVSNAGEFALMAGPVQQGVVAAGGILVSPNGTTGGDLLSGTSIFGAGDLKVMDQLVACAVKNNNVDPHKIYTMGCSAGGLMATATATERSSYIASAAPNSGGWTAPVPWQDMHTPALMTVHGAMGSDVVIVDFSQTSATADKAFKTHGGFVIDCNTGGGHCGGGGLAGDVWKFFQAHPFGVNPEPWASMLPSGFSSQCKIQ